MGPLGYDRSSGERLSDHKRRLRLRLWALQGGLCHYCNYPMTWRPAGALPGPSDDTFEHVHPVIAGGDDELPNLVLCCSECNAGRGKSFRRSLAGVSAAAHRPRRSGPSAAARRRRNRRKNRE